jgi:hypothetical protein
VASHAVRLGVLLVGLAVSGGCESETISPGEIQGPWNAERDQIGDTAVVRTVSGSVWGDTATLAVDLAIGELEGDPEYLLGRPSALDVYPDGRIVVADAQARVVRVYSPTGEHLHTFGREGDGPGEFRRPDHLRVLRDGRIVVRDQSAARFSLFSEGGEYITGWPRGSGFSTSAPFFLDPTERVVNPTLRSRLISYDLEGTARDTIDVPTRGFSPPELEVLMERGRASYSIPFMPHEHWALTRDGRLLFGTSDQYRFDRSDARGQVLRIERAVEPVSITEDHAAQERERLTRTVRRLNEPNWRWNGPDVPATKPLFVYLLPGLDGTVWVMRELPSVEEPDPAWDAEQPDRGFPTRWTRRVVADVFDEDGRYLGPVSIPESLNWGFPPAVVSADHVWAVATHEFGHPQVLRLRVTSR